MKKYVPQDEQEAAYLAAYNPDKWKKPSVTADMAVFAYENIFPIGQQTSIINLATELKGKNLNPKKDTLDVDFYLYKKENHKQLIKHFQIKKPIELLK